MTHKSYSRLYFEWMAAADWAMFTSNRPVPPTREEAQVTADQEWEHEGGSIKPSKKPAAEPEAKIPF